MRGDDPQHSLSLLNTRARSATPNGAAQRAVRRVDAMRLDRQMHNVTRRPLPCPASDGKDQASTGQLDYVKCGFDGSHLPRTALARGDAWNGEWVRGLSANADARSAVLVLVPCPTIVPTIPKVLFLVLVGFVSKTDIPPT